MLLPWLSGAALFLASMLSITAAERARVALITNQEGAHRGEYLSSLRDSADTDAVLLAAPSVETAAEARKVLGHKLGGSYATAAELFAKNQVHLTLVSLEPRLATPAIEAALDAGSHVLAEKPAVLSIADFARLAQKANAKKLHLMLALANRLNPDTQFALDLIRQNKLGKIYGLELHLVADQTRLTRPAYHNSWYAQKARGGGGHLIWLGLHWMDLAMYLTGSDVTEIAGFTTNIGGQKIDVEDSAVMSLKFRDGFLGTMTSGYYLDRGYHSHLKIWGATGWIEMNRHGSNEPFRYYSTTDAKPEIKTYVAPNTPAGYPPFVNACVRASLGLAAPPITTNESLRIIQTIFTAYEAAATGRTQRIPIVGTK